MEMETCSMCDKEKQLLNSEMKAKLVMKTVMKQIKPKNNTAKTILKKLHYSGKRDFKELEVIETLLAQYVNMMWKITSSTT